MSLSVKCLEHADIHARRLRWILLFFRQIFADANISLAVLFKLELNLELITFAVAVLFRKSNEKKKKLEVVSKRECVFKIERRT